MLRCGKRFASFPRTRGVSPTLGPGIGHGSSRRARSGPQGASRCPPTAGRLGAGGASPSSRRPIIPDPDARSPTVERQLASFPPLVFAGEARKLKKQLGPGLRAARRSCCRAAIAPRAFAEHAADNIRDFFRVFLQMAVVTTFAAALPVVKVGRVAGQFAKPRSAPTETLDGVELPSYRGDIVNDIEFTAGGARIPDPAAPAQRLPPVGGDAEPAARLRVTGGYANLENAHRWMLGFVKDSARNRYRYQRARRPDLGNGRLHAGDRPRSREPSRAALRPSSTRRTKRCCSATRRR